MKWLKKSWDYFKGKKRNIGIIAGFILKGITLVFPEVIPSETATYIDSGINLFLVGGVLDNARRTTKVGNQIDKVVKKKATQLNQKIVKSVKSKKL